MRIRTIIIISAMLLTISSAIARPVRIWTVEDLLSESDFVVLAQVQDVTDGPTHTKLMRDVPAIEKRSTLRVVHFFKQNAAVAQMTLKWYQPEEWPPSGPSGFKPELGGYYLMFLKRDLGLQRFQSVTGEIDPDMGLFPVSRSEKPEVLPADSQVDTIMNLLSEVDTSQTPIPPRNKEELRGRFQKDKDEEIQPAP
jgi:hypothetical protein